MRLLILAALPLIAAAECPPGGAPLPAGFAAWRAPIMLPAGRDPAGAPSLPPGKAARVTLLPVARLRFAAPPEHAPAAGSRGALIALEVTKPGGYTVALGTAAWIDLVRDGKPIASTGHQHGPACSGIRKLVRFDLTPGRYLIQLSGAKISEVVLQVAPA